MCGAPFLSIIMKSISELVAEIKRYNDSYRLGTPIVSDSIYDQLVDELRQRDPDNDWLKKAEPAPVSNKRKRKLPTPMKSLNKAKSLSEVKQWLNSLAIPDTAELVIMPKFDGVSWLHDEETGETYSRGGADNEGQSCLGHYLMGDYGNVEGWGMFLCPRFTFGELVFNRQSWEKNFVGKKSDATGEPYRSPRNTIAGFINRDEPSPLIKYADFFRYGVGESDIDYFTSYEEIIQTLCEVFGQPQFFQKTPVKAIDDECLMQLFKEWQRHYYIDGLVIYLNDLNLWKAIGRQQTTGNPLYAIAYKHPDFTDTFETTVKGIDWKVSKAGALKPVVNIEAVDTGDCTMETPTGYNAKYIFTNGIGRGAKIEVTRSGGVIPKIINVLREADCDVMMEQRDNLLYCPNCGKPTKWNDSSVELVCTNPSCPGVTLAKVCHFYKTVDAEQMGEETISKLFAAGYDTLCRILDITFDEVLLIDGFGESIANIILETNKRIRAGIEVTKLMHASDCFQGIGQVKAKQILSDLSEGDRYAFINGHVFIEDGFDKTPRFKTLNKTMQSFLKGIVPFYDFVASNRLAILPLEEAPKPVGTKYVGMKVCFTGVRDKELEAEIIAQGGEVVNNISKNTTHLIVADLASSSWKAVKARSWNIPLFTIEGFKSL